MAFAIQLQIGIATPVAAWLRVSIPAEAIGGGLIANRLWWRSRGQWNHCKAHVCGRIGTRIERWSRLPLVGLMQYI